MSTPNDNADEMIVPEGFDVFEITGMGVSKCLVMNNEGVTKVGGLWLEALPFYPDDVAWCEDPECELGEHALVYRVGYPMSLQQIEIMIGALIDLWWDLANHDEKAARLREMNADIDRWGDGHIGGRGAN